MSVDDYVDALDRELAGHPRALRREETLALREHLGELPPEALTELGDPRAYAASYRISRDFPKRRVASWWARRSVAGRVALIVAPLVVLALVVGAVWVSHYQPLEVRVDGGGPDRSSAEFETSSVDLAGGTVLSYRDGAIYDAFVQFRNPSAFAVTIDRLAGLPSAGLLQFVGYHSVPEEPAGCCVAPALRQFPLRVPPGATVGLGLAFRMTNCEHYQGAGDAVGYDTFPLELTVLGVHHRSALRPSSTLWVKLDGKHACPRPFVG